MKPVLQSLRKTHTLEESTYRNMKSRCYNTKATGYKNYGGRGITMCDSWKESFWSFHEDMGVRLKGLSLDRIDPHGNYCKENCRWVTAKEQGNNKTKHFMLEYEGVSLNLSQWGEALNILPNTLLYRLNRGWKTAEALEKTPRSQPWTYRFSKEKIQWIVSEVQAKGRTQTSVGLEVGMHSSQVSRLCSTFGRKKK